MALVHADPSLLADLDQHQRYLAAALLLKPLLEPLGRPARLLEVGSNVLHLLPAFLAPLPVEVVRADVIDVPLEGSRFVRLSPDGQLPFPDDVFDFVVALEVLEHIPREDRLFALAEWSRVARHGVLFSCPRRHRAVRAAERRVDRHYRARHGQPHPWLSEHEQLGIPSRGEIRALLGKLGMRAHVFGNAPLSDWLPLQFLSEELSQSPSGLREYVQQVLNSRPIQALTRRRPYRRLYVAFKHEEAARRAVALWRRGDPDFTPDEPVGEFDPVARLIEHLRRLLLTQPGIDTLQRQLDASRRQEIFARRRAEIAEREAALWRFRTEELCHLGPRWRRWCRSLWQRVARRSSDLKNALAAQLRPVQELGPDCWEAIGFGPHWLIQRTLQKGWVSLRLSGHGPAGETVQLWLHHSEEGAPDTIIELGTWTGGSDTWQRYFYIQHAVARWRLQPSSRPGLVRLTEFNVSTVSTLTVLRRGWLKDLAVLARGRGWLDLWRTWRYGGWRAVLRRPLSRLLTAQERGQAYPCSYAQVIDRQRPTPARVAHWLCELSSSRNVASMAVCLPIVGPFQPADLDRTLNSLASHQSLTQWELAISVCPPQQGKLQAALAKYPTLSSRCQVLVLPPAVERQADHLNALLEKITTDFAVLLRSGEMVAHEGLLRLAVALTQHPTADCVYTDEDCWHPESGRHAPRLFPAWSPETFLAGPALGGLIAVRRSACRQVGGLAPGHEGAHVFDLIARLAARNPAGIVHVAQVLLHRPTAAGEPAVELDALARVVSRHLDEGTFGVFGDVILKQATWRIRPRLVGAPRVSIIIPTAGRPITLDGQVTTHIEHLLASLKTLTAYPNYEVIVVDNGQLDPTVADQLARSDVRRLSVPGPFNFAANLNLAAQQATGELLLFLNDDMEVLHADWLEELVRWAVQPAIGVVGGRLYFADGRLQHGGIVLYEPGPGHPLYGEPAMTPVFDPTFHRVRNWLAVTGACLMTPRAVFQQLGGFDERFRLNYNDVDYCLRVIESGKRVVCTSHAELIHFERLRRDGRAAFQVEELTLFQQRWRSRWPRDPFLNDHFSPRHHDFRLDEQRARDHGA